jgi:hypothetical protein
MKSELSDNHLNVSLDAPYGNSYYGNTFYVNSWLEVGKTFEAIICRSNSRIESVFVRGTDFTVNPVKNPNFFNNPIEIVTMPACTSIADAAGKVTTAFLEYVEQKLVDNDCLPRYEPHFAPVPGQWIK